MGLSVTWLEFRGEKRSEPMKLRVVWYQILREGKDARTGTVKAGTYSVGLPTIQSNVTYTCPVPHRYRNAHPPAPQKSNVLAPRFTRAI